MGNDMQEMKVTGIRQQQRWKGATGGRECIERTDGTSDLAHDDSCMTDPCCAVCMYLCAGMGDHNLVNNLVENMVINLV